MVDFGETELPVDFRTVERVAVPGEDDALYVGCAAAHPELGSAPFVPSTPASRGSGVRRRAARGKFHISFCPVRAGGAP